MHKINGQLEKRKVFLLIMNCYLMTRHLRPIYYLFCYYKTGINMYIFVFLSFVSNDINNFLNSNTDWIGLWRMILLITYLIISARQMIRFV